MIGRECVLFGRRYVWELFCIGVRNAGTPMVETVTQWRLTRCTCGEAWAGHPNPHALTCPLHHAAEENAR